jgi:serine/threonine protein kinase
LNSALAKPRMLARFQLLRELGRGAQATVWLAHDPRLDREVALKLLSADADEATRHEWLNEARAVSRLKHPNIVPVFEADEHEGQPYLVFEYVEGPTLQARRKQRAAWPAREAVGVVLGVLDALCAAHEQGIVHRDLKPSNVLLGGDGRARVMDFGIAARVAEPGKPAVGDGMVVGTPGYISPEAARGEAPVPAMDVFSAGVVLGELLAGAPLLRETDPYRAIARVQKEDLLLPAHVKVDEALRGIVHRALARNVAERYDSAKSLHAALSAWLNPAAASEQGPGSPAALEFLLRRMRHKTDFPALSSSVVRIQRLAMSETESLGRLSDEILKDVSLTNKLLRMVNTAHFTSVAGGGISTVSRAVALVGFAGIRNMALSVILLEHMGDKAHAALLKEEFLRALMAGTLASDLTPLARESEEAFLGAMFQNLGRLLTEYYFPEEALHIRQRLAQAADTPFARDAAARQILGLGLDELGAGVAKAWGLPDTLQRALRVPEGDVPTRMIDRRVDSGVERLRWLGRGANALTDAMLLPDVESQTAALAAMAESYAPALGLQPRDVLHSVQGARTRLSHLAQAMGLQVAPNAPARRLLQTEVARQADVDRTVATNVMAVPDATQRMAAPGLADGLERVRKAVAERSLRLNELLNLVLETVQQTLDMRCVVFCLRDPKSGQLIGRVALGPGSMETSAAFRITPAVAAGSDLFAAVCAKGADLLISDAKAVAAKLPGWYRQKVNAPTFLLLPLLLKGAPIGLIYADKATAGSIVLGETELGLLRGLRDQAVAAFSRGAR